MVWLVTKRFLDFELVSNHNCFSMDPSQQFPFNHNVRQQQNPGGGQQFNPVQYNAGGAQFNIVGGQQLNTGVGQQFLSGVGPQFPFPTASGQQFPTATGQQMIPYSAMSSYLQELPQIPDPTIRSPGDTQVYDGQTAINSVNLNQKGTLPDETGNSSNDKTRWTETDDVLLCSAWLNASVNPIVGIDQNAKVLWKDVCGYFNRHRQVHQAERNKQGVSTRWKRLNTAVGKFVGCYEEAVRLRQSGTNEADQIGLAKDLFLKKVGKKFGFMQANDE